MKRIVEPSAAHAVDGYRLMSTKLSHSGRFLPLCMKVFILYLLIPGTDLQGLLAKVKVTLSDPDFLDCSGCHVLFAAVCGGQW